MDSRLDPTVADLGKTHIFPTYAILKPFVALAYEYVKITPDKGPADISQSAGLAHTALGAPVPNQGAGGEVISFQIPQRSTFFCDMVYHFQLTGLSGLYDNAAAAPDPPSTSANRRDKVKYATLLGHRAVRTVEFTVNGNPIDSYTTEDMNAYFFHELPIGKQEAYLRCIGQEIPSIGYLTPDPRLDEFREIIPVAHGAQTLKFSHPTVDIWLPLLFWFNDPAQAFVDTAIVNGQRRINFYMASPVEITAGVDTNQVLPITDYVYPHVVAPEMYIRYITTNPEINDIILKRISFSMYRQHLQQTKALTQTNGQVLLNAFKFPIERFYFAFRPRENIIDVDDWYKSSVLTTSSIETPVITAFPAPDTLATNLIQYQTGTPTVDTLSLRANDIELYPAVTEQFYNRYMHLWQNACCWPSPGGNDLLGWYTMHFALNAGQYQPSGFINVSKTREFYLLYTSSYISVTHKVDLIALGTALGFLLVTNGSAVSRFST
jgi:hypothetical protein